MSTRSRAVLGVAAAVGAVIAGAAATVGAAMLTDRIVLVLAAGAVAEVLVAWTTLGLLAVGRGLRGTAVAALLTATAVATLLPLPDPPRSPTPVAGESRWPIDTTTSLRYVHLRGNGPNRNAPVVFLHGGPGVPDMAGDTAFLRPLTDDGFDLYVYDAIGSGGSTRLPDPTDYAVSRDVADLEHVRTLIGADRLVLVGHSYGGLLAAHYLAAHPDHVEKLVLISPQSLDPADGSGGLVTARLDPQRLLRLAIALLAPRALLGYTLLQVNPTVAHAYLPDAEADARNDEVLTISRPALHGTGSAEFTGPATDDSYRGSGFYRLQYPQSPVAPPPADVRPVLRGMTQQALILKGGADYLSWSSAITYRRTLPHSVLAYYPEAGHNVYQDRPTAARSAIRAFLTGTALPAPPYSSLEVPAGYEGPP